jgi:glutathione S-transferase
MMCSRGRIMLTLYDGETSGHCHKIRLMLSILGVDYERVAVALAAGENRAESFLNRNPFGQIPVLDDDGEIIRDSNAILVYLAAKYGSEHWLPQTPLAWARVQEWLAVSSLKIYNGPVKARAVRIFGRDWDHEAAVSESNSLLAMMDSHLSGQQWLALGQPTIADIACYTYIAHAPEGDIDLSAYREVNAWLRRLEALPGFIAMPPTCQ